MGHVGLGTNCPIKAELKTQGQRQSRKSLREKKKGNLHKIRGGCVRALDRLDLSGRRGGNQIDIGWRYWTYTCGRGGGA